MKTFVFLLGAAAVVSYGTLAQAAIQITYSINGGPTVTCLDSADSNGPVVCPNVSTPIQISLLNASSNSPGGVPLGQAQEFSGVNVIANNTSLSAATLVIGIEAQGFTAPTAPPDIILNSHIGGSIANGSADNLLNFQSCVDTTDSLTGCSVASIQSSVGSPDITTAGSFKNDQFGTITSLSAAYAIDESITLTLGANSSINFGASTTLTPVPEPASIAMLGGVLLFVSSVLIRRKRSEAAQN